MFRGFARIDEFFEDKVVIFNKMAIIVTVHISKGLSKTALWL